ncbi:MAG TPA: retropepsin-like aspartic protease [Hanamia sp.]|nr:retropepsin-like aspartic protease [Hanamia sp.]
MFKKIILFFILFFSAELIYTQNLSIPQTIDYINNKLEQNPCHTDGFTYSYSIALDANGEVSIIEKNKMDDNPWKIYKTVFYASNVSISPYNTAEDLSGFISIGHFNFVCNDSSACFRTTIVQTTNPLDYDFSNSFKPIMLAPPVGETIFNAFTYLFHLFSLDPRYNKPKEIDPFATVDNKKITIRNSEDTQEVIHMQKMEGGIYEIPVVINDVLKISFIFDTGASDVSISPDVALTLIRTGTVKESDFIGSQTYFFADGSKATSRRFIIKKLTIGSHTATNVIASISKSINAPMLLGQSVQQQFGKIVIDNTNHVLIFTK